MVSLGISHIKLFTIFMNELSVSFPLSSALMLISMFWSVDKLVGLRHSLVIEENPQISSTIVKAEENFNHFQTP
jgi:hypothetical protein